MRSYAYIQLMRADLAAFSTYINSTSYQVYNKAEAGEASRQAVEETKHEVMTYADEVIEAYYFQRRWGTLTLQRYGMEEMDHYGYLKKVCLNTPETDLDLSDEKAFSDYILDTADGI